MLHSNLTRQPAAPPQPFWLTAAWAYGPLVALLLGVAALGIVGTGLARLVFIGGSFAVSVLAYRSGGLSRHVEVCIVLFVFGPFLRRIIDLRIGYDESATMLVGPLLALTAVYPELKQLLSSRRNFNFLAPFILALVCVTYGWTASAFQENIVAATIGATKYTVPMLYSICLAVRPDESNRVLSAATRVFLFVSPIIGIYGIVQYTVLPSWDRFWIISSKIPSLGLPLPQQFRVFSTMNSPSSFASYASCGLMLFSFVRSFIPPLLVPIIGLLPLSLAILLSGIRTSWITTAIALAFCMLFSQTRNRAVVLVLCLGVGVVGALSFTPFGEAIETRINTLSNGVAQDGSGFDRLHDYGYVFTEGDRYLFGVGFAATTVDPNLIAYDGQLLSSVVQMGIVVGVLHTVAVLWAAAQAVLLLRRSMDVTRLVAASIIISYMSVFVLLAFSYGETGFLFWMLVGAMTATPLPPPRRLTV